MGKQWKQCQTLFFWALKSLQMVTAAMKLKDAYSLDEVKWALGSITTNKARGGDGIPVELFQILEDDAVKVLQSIFQQIWKTQHGHRTGKGQFSFQSKRKAMPKNVQTTAQLHSSHMLVSSRSKSFKLDFKLVHE